MPRIFYKSGYKYKLDSTYSVQTNITNKVVSHEYFKLNSKGVLTISKGYAWDGATSFPDLKTIIRGSLVHDCLYQMIRLKLLPTSVRDEADELLRAICIQDGMNSVLAWTVYRGVRLFASSAAKSPEKPVESAP